MQTGDTMLVRATGELVTIIRPVRSRGYRAWLCDTGYSQVEYHYLELKKATPQAISEADRKQEADELRFLCSL